jgi:hypothetical protein
MAAGRRLRQKLFIEVVVCFKEIITGGLPGEERFAARSDIFGQLGMDMFTALHDGIGEIDGYLIEGEEVGAFGEFGEVFLAGVVGDELVNQSRGERGIERVIVNGIDNAGGVQAGVVAVHAAEVEGGQGSEPAMAVDEVGYPPEFFDGFQCAADVENTACVVVFKLFAGVGTDISLTFEKVFIINEIYLHTCGLYGGYFDGEGVIGIADNEIHTGEAYDFVELVTPVINGAELGHERPYLFPSLLNSLRQFSAE